MRFGFYDNRDNRNNGLVVNSMLSVDNNKNNFYQPEDWLPLDPTFTFVALKAFPWLLSVNKWTLFTTTKKRPNFTSVNCFRALKSSVIFCENFGGILFHSCQNSNFQKVRGRKLMDKEPKQ